MKTEIFSIYRLESRIAVQTHRSNLVVFAVNRGLASW